MESLLAQRAALVVARSSGALETEFSSGGTRRRVTFRSMPELIQAIAAIDRDIAALQGKRVNTFLPTFRSGFE
ncbi:MAG: phage head-tail joining protein [Allorhizobium sp.]